MIKKTIACIFLSLISCSQRETVFQSIPYATVYYPLLESSKQYAEIQLPGSWIMIKQKITENTAIGLGGLLIVHSIGNYNYTDLSQLYYAYDLACPVEANPEVKIQVDKKNITSFVCHNCHSRYDNLFSGYSGASQGPAFQRKLHLKLYHISPIRGGLLIHN